MPKLTRKEIQFRALVLLNSMPSGLRWSVLLKGIQQSSPETPANSIQGALLTLIQNDADIVKVARGTYQLSKYVEAQSIVSTMQEEAVSGQPVIVDTASHTAVSMVESDFYSSFAQWLVDGAEEVTAAVELGGSVLKGKWGTPDVIGVLRPRKHDLLQFEPQIVSAEIKIDPGQPVTAFGQAIAYRLFSHKSFIVVPDTTSQDDQARLKALCSIHGVGLVTFTLDTTAPDYSILVSPAQASPDMFYANQMLRRLLDHSQATFNKLFG